jgi:hypothetical protein
LTAAAVAATVPSDQSGRTGLAARFGRGGLGAATSRASRNSLRWQPPSVNDDNRNIEEVTQQSHTLQDDGQGRAVVRTAVENDVKTISRGANTCSDVRERDNVKIRMGFREHSDELLPAQPQPIDQGDPNARDTRTVSRHGRRRACRLDFGRHRHVPPMVSDRKVAVYPQSQNSVKFLTNATPLRHLPRL